MFAKSKSFTISFIVILSALLIFFGCQNPLSSGDEEKDDDPPNPVRDLVAADVGEQSVTLSWSDPDDSDLNHIEITWNPTGSTPKLVDPNIETYTATGLATGTEYTFMVGAVDDNDYMSIKETVKVTPMKNYPNFSYTPSYPVFSGDITNLTPRYTTHGPSFHESFLAGGEVDGNYLFVKGDSEIIVYSLSNPLEPERVHREEISDGRDIAVDQGYLYMTTSVGFDIYNLSDIHNWTLTASIPTDTSFASPDSIHLSSNRAYVALGYKGVAIIDVSDRTNPAVLDTNNNLEVNDSVGYFLGEANYAYGIAKGRTYVFDISDPANIQRVNKFEESSSLAGANKHTIQNGYLFINNTVLDSESSNLDIYDIGSNPASPSLVSSLQVDSGDVIIDGHLMYVNDFLDKEGTIVDISNIENPTIIQSINYTDQYYSQVGSVDVALYGNYFYIMDQTGMTIADVSNPQAAGLNEPYDMSLVSRIQVGEPGKTIVQDNRAYVSRRQAGFDILNIENPDAPTEIVQVDTYDVWDLDVKGNYLYLADYKEGLKIYDISDEANPLLVNNFYSDNKFSKKLFITSNYLFLGNENELYIMDIEDPENPFAIANLWIMDLRAFAIQGSNLYVATYDSLYTYDISTISDPILLDTISFSSVLTVQQLLPRNDVLYMSDYNSGDIYVYDISNSEKPSLNNTFTLESQFPWQIGFSGDYFLAMTSKLDSGELWVYDTSSNPFAPSLIGNAIDVPSKSLYYSLTPDHVYIKFHTKGFWVMD